MIRCLLWDFGNTLADELSLWRASDEWMDVYQSFFDVDGIGAAWSLGEIDLDEVANRLSERMSLSAEEIIAHLHRADLFDFFPATHDFFRARHLPQAIVTVNPAFFRPLAAKLGLDAFVETTVISAEEGTADKGVLCQLALDRMPGSYEPAEALLVDNKEANVARWAECGGVGYLFTTDEAFARDTAGGVDALAAVGP